MYDCTLAKRIVVKVGTSTLTHENGKANLRRKMCIRDRYSAMRSAEGEVQHLEYTATFPLLLNIGNQPTYVIALKDEAGLVKMYAMVNVSRYQIVGAGSSIAETEQNYLRLLKDNNLYDGEVDTLPPSDGEQAETEVTSGVIADIRSAVLEGTTMYYPVSYTHLGCCKRRADASPAPQSGAAPFFRPPCRCRCQ